MVDLVVTAASVIADAAAKTTEGTAGAAITAGQVVYLDPATSTYKLADSNGTADARSPDGIALHAAAIGQPVEVAQSGPVTIGATLVAGTDYWLSDTPGGICPRADVGATEYPTLIGLATSTTVLKVKIQESGVAV